MWQYGQTGQPGSGADQLIDPASVQSFTAGPDRGHGRGDGNVLICDRGARRVIEVSYAAKSIVWRYPAGGAPPLQAPGCALGSDGSDGTIWIADAASGRVLGVATGASPDAPAAHTVFASYGSVPGPSSPARSRSPSRCRK